MVCAGVCPVLSEIFPPRTAAARNHQPQQHQPPSVPTVSRVPNHQNQTHTHQSKIILSTPSAFTKPPQSPRTQKRERIRPHFCFSCLHQLAKNERPHRSVTGTMPSNLPSIPINSIQNTATINCPFNSTEKSRCSPFCLN